ncbi:hypothetical protein DYB32_002721 [Aphanomyces invadans]|uniref:Ribosomal protein L46 N-terminal domain-containing protein n=1 Tax=Aphanomyces invadans TaxID=157072 RepID=A0A3R6W0M2_9STRA|nr:hypothetical protein DYB32_002721 [Aphanomyces invadans]
MQRVLFQAVPLTRQFASKSSKKANKTLIKPANAKAPHRSRGPSHKMNQLLPLVDDGKTYRIVFASILERLPLILPDMEPWEEAYYRMKHKIEIKEAMDFWFKEPGAVDVEPEDAPFLSEWNEDELVGDGFQLAKRETEDDATNNRHSLNRALKQRVFLIVQDPVSLKWTLPTTEKAADETMRDAAFRELADTIGDQVEAYPVGNAPMGHLVVSHENEPDFDGKVHGTKMFFLKAQTFGNEGVVNLNKAKAADYLWVTQAELAEYLEPHVAEVVVKVVPP